MSTAFTDIERLAVGLPVDDRARLADRLIASLPADYIDSDGIEEAMRRSRELEENPELAISLKDFDRKIRERFGWK